MLHVTSSAYDPQSQGTLERYHQTLKSMLKKYWNETGNEWDKGVSFLIFATSEILTESLGFSPNELAFRHEMIGPLVMKEMWNISKKPPTNVLKYVSEFKECLYHSSEMVESNFRQSQ